MNHFTHFGTYYRMKYSVVLKYTEKDFIGLLMQNGSIAKHRYDTEVNEFHSVMGEIVPQCIISAVFCDISL